MDPKKVFIYGFFGLFGAIILSLLSAVGGFAGAGVSLLIISVFGNVLISSLIGGASAAIAFHALIQGVDTFLVKAADQKSQKSGQEVSR